MIALIPLLVMLVGLVVWFVSVPSPKPWAELGRLMFFCGLLVLVMVLANETFQVGLVRR